MVTDFKFIIAEAIFGNYAHFGSAIINKDWMISGNGYVRTSSGELYFVESGDFYGDDVTPAYLRFDSTDPEAKNTGAFLPSWCVDLLTGKMIAAKGNFVVNHNGDVVIRGALMYHNALLSGLFNGSPTKECFSITSDSSYRATSAKLLCDRYIVSGVYSGSGGVYIDLPPAKLFQGVEIKIILVTWKGSTADAPTTHLRVSNYTFYNLDPVVAGSSGGDDANNAVNRFYSLFSGISMNEKDSSYYDMLDVTTCRTITLTSTLHPIWGNTEGFTDCYTWTVTDYTKR